MSDPESSDNDESDYFSDQFDQYECDMAMDMDIFIDFLFEVV